jgi:hypothetical protein
MIVKEAVAGRAGYLVTKGFATVRHRTAFGLVTTIYRGKDSVPAGALTHYSVHLRADFALPAGSSVALARRWPSDWGEPQWTSSREKDFARIYTTGASALKCATVRRHTWHPFDHAFVVQLESELAVGDVLVLEFGGTFAEGLGFSAQTFIEEASPLSVRLQVGTSGEWEEVAKPCIRVVGAAPSRLVVTPPSWAAVGQIAEIHVRIEDIWGNPASLDQPLPVVLEIGVEESLALELPAAQSWARVEVTPQQAGLLQLRARAVDTDLEHGTCPFNVLEKLKATRLAWGDLHAQSVIGCGVRSIADYYRHARDFAATDFGSHQANCFLVSAEEWQETQDGTREAHSPGHFVTLLGVEWSGASRLGGDHNLYFPDDTAELRRCSHQFVADKSDLDKDLPHVNDVYAHYEGTDTLIAVHVGGRTADLQYHSPELDRLLEIHSTHATSEWFLFEALRRGYRFGVIAGSDSVDGRPGASHPGRMGVRNVRGGLTAVEVEELTRPAIWKALRARRCYATTGERIVLSFCAGELRMGDEAARTLRSGASFGSFAVEVIGTAGIEAIDFFRDDVLLQRIEPAAWDHLSNRVRVAWRGATAPGNWERARMNWDGGLLVEGARILSAKPWAMDTPSEGVTYRDDERVSWRSVTAGDWDGVVLQLDRRQDAKLTFATRQMTVCRELGSLDSNGWTCELESPKRTLEIKPLPKDEPPLRVCHEFMDDAPLVGKHAYWVRVRQADGAYAWSTPIFLNITTGDE